MAQFYQSAAHLLDQLLKKKATIKSAVFSNHGQDTKRMHKVLCETLRYKEPITAIIENSQISKTEKMLAKNQSLLLILTHELLFGNGISGNFLQKKLILQHKTRLNAELVKLKIKRKVKKNEDLVPEQIKQAVVLPRYIRVNCLVTTIEKVIQHFVSEGYTLIPSTEKLVGKTIQKDEHLPDLLILPSGIDLHDHELLKQGKIIMQDKASCFPAFILSPPHGATVIDACAAPGNKTSHLSSIMGNTGKIYAFDADKRRLETLKRLSQRAQCTNIQPIHQDFLTVHPKDYPSVEYILLDPSCSGSGIVGRLDHLMGQDEEQEEQKDRLDSLAEFQVKALLHAFTFPNVKRVVYSTCSKHAEENEMVVQRVLETQSMFKLASHVFPQWQRRGLALVDGRKIYDIHVLLDQELIRTDPQQDQTIGFFVALFERK